VRLTAPPVQPLPDERSPIFRAQAPDTEHGAGWSDLPRQQASSRPGYLPEGDRFPESNPRASSNLAQAPTTDPWHPAVRLGVPQFGGQPASSSQRVPASASPV